MRHSNVQRLRGLIPAGARLAASAVVVLLFAASASAQDVFQVTSGGTGDYDTSTNWSSGVPVTGSITIGDAAYNNVTATYTTSTPITDTTTGSLINIGDGSGATGTLTLSGSAGTLTFDSSAYPDGIYLGYNGGTGNLNVDAGTVSLPTGEISVGEVGASTGTLTVAGGSVTCVRLTLGDGVGATAIANLNSGSITLTGTGGNEGLLFGGGGAGSGTTGTFNLNGGTLYTSEVTRYNGSGTYTFNFNGGTIQATGTTSNFLSSSVTYDVNSGGAYFNDGGFSVTVTGTALVHAGAGTDGGLTKNGSGTLIFDSGCNLAYNGTTTVNAGVLRLDYASGLTGNVAVNNTALLVLTDFKNIGPSQLTTPEIDLTGGTITGWAASPQASYGIYTNAINIHGNGLSSTIGLDSGAPSPYGGEAPPVWIDYNGATGSNDTLTITVDSGATGNISSVLGVHPTATATGNLVVAGSGTLILSGANTYNGSTTVNGGTLIFSSPNSNTYSGNGININNGSTVEIMQSGGANRYNFATTWTFDSNGGDTITTGSGLNYVFTGTNTFTTNGGASDNINGSSGINMNSGPSIVFNVALGTDPTSDLTVSLGMGNSSGGLTKNGAGRLTLTGANSYTGTTTISGGTLRIGNGGTTGTLGAAGVTDNAALVFDRSDSYGGNVTNAISGSGSLTLTAGSLTLSGANTYMGATIVNGGTLTMASGSMPATAVTINNGGTLSFTETANDQYTNATSTTINAGGMLTMAGGLSAFIHNLTLAGGTLADPNPYFYGNWNFFTGETINVIGNATSTISATAIDNWQSGTLAFNVASGSTLDVTGAIGDAGHNNAGFGISLAGSGTMVLSGVNIYLGTTAVSGGTMEFSNTSALYNGTTTSWTPANIKVASGATLAFAVGGVGQWTAGSGSGATISGLLADLAGSGSATGLEYGSIIGFDTTGGNFAYNSAIANTNSGSNAIGVAVYGGNALTLSGANTYTGGTSLQNGTLRVGAANSLSAGSTITFGTSSTNGTLDLNGFGAQIAGLAVGSGAAASAQTITNNSTSSNAVLTVSSAGSSSFGGSIQDGTGGYTTGLTTSGSTTLTLTGTNNFSGPTTVGGTSRLYVNGTNANSAVTVSSGATLGGTGTVGGGAAISSGGILEAGQSGSGTLTLSSLSFAGTGTVNIGISGSLTQYAAATSGPLAVNDTGVLTAGGGVGSVVINLPTAGVPNGTYRLIGYSGSIVGPNGFNAFTLGTEPPTGARVFDTLTNNANEIDLVVAGDYPIWTGAYSSEWSTNTLPSPKNWTLSDGSGPTDFLTGDTAHFTSAATNQVVDISQGNVNPASAIFDSGNYTLESTPGLYGIASGVVFLNGGSLTVTNVNTYAGGTTLNAGLLSFVNGGLGSGPITFAGNATLQWNGTNTQDVSSQLAIANGVTATIDTQANDVTFGTSFGSGSSGSLIKMGSGMLTLSASNGYTGGTTLQAGMISFANGGLGSGSVTFAGNSTLQWNGTNTQDISGSLIINSGVTATFDTQANNVTFASAFGGGASGGIDKTGTGMLTITATPTYTGPTTVDGGTLTMASGAMPATAVTINNGGTLSLTETGNDQYTAATSTTINAGGVLTMTGGWSAFIHNLTLAGGTLADPTPNVPFGSWNFFTGEAIHATGNATSTISAGNIDNWQGGALAFNVDSGSTLDVTGTIGDTGHNSVGFGISLNGSGTMVLSGANTYLGSTALSGGTLRVSGSGTLGATSSALAVNGGTLDLDGTSQAVGNFTGIGGTVLNDGSGAATLTIGGGNATGGNYQGVIADNDNADGGTVALTKIGTGTIRLGGVNTYSGATDINAGTLALGSTAGLGNTAITVASGATLLAQPGSGIMTIGSMAPSLGASLILSPGIGSSAGGSFSMVDGGIGTVDLQQGSGFSGPALMLGGSGMSVNAPTLSFEIGGSLGSIDTLAVGGGVSVGATGAVVNISPLSTDTTLARGNYPFITAASGLGPTALTLASSTLYANGVPYGLSLANSTSTAEVLTVTPMGVVPTVQAFSSQLTSASRQAVNTVNSIVPAGNTYTNSPNGTMWTTVGNTVNPSSPDFSPYITYNLGGDYNITGIEVWNYNENGFVKIGADSVRILADSNPTPVTPQGTVTFPVASGLSTYTGSLVPVTLSDVQYVTFQILTTYDGAIFWDGAGDYVGNTDTRGLTGLAQIRFIGTLAAETWDPNGNQTDGGGNWDTASSLWYTGSSDTTWINDGTVNATFGYAGGTGGTVTLQTGINTASVTFNADPGNFTIIGNGNTLTLGAGGIAVAATDGTETFDSTLSIALSASQIWTNNSTVPGQSLTVNSAVSATTAGTTLTIAGAGNTTVGGTISDGTGQLSLIMSGNGVLTLSGANTYTGATTISAGTLQLGNANAVQNSTVNIGVANGLTFTPGIGNGTFLLGGLSGSANESLQDTGGGAVNLQVGGNGASTVFSGNLSGIGSLTMAGAGVLTLSGSNNIYSGGTAIQNGTLRAGAANALPVAGTVTFGAMSTNGTLDLNGYGLTVGGLAVASAASSNAASQIITNSNTSNVGSTATLIYAGATPSTFGGTLKDGSNGLLALTVSSGALTLTGANTYSGATAVTGGTLRVANTTGSATGPLGSVSVSSGAVLSGGGGATPGTISGSVNILGGGTIAPSGGGSAAPGSIGTLTVGALTLTSNSNNASQLDYQVVNTASLDLIAVTSALTLPTANNGTPVQFSFYPVGSNSNLMLAAGSGPYYLMTYNTLGAGFNPAALSVNPNDLPSNNQPVFSLGMVNGFDAIELNIVTNSVSAAWVSPGGGSTDYGNSNNWSPGSVPSGIGLIATFGTGSQLTVSVNGAYTVGQLNFNGSIPSASYYLTGNGSLTLNNSGSGASVNVSSGGLSPAIATTLVLADASLTTTFNVASGSSLDLSGTINESTPTGQQIVLSGGGVLTMEGSNNFTGGTTIQNGTLVANASGVLGTGSLTFNPGSGNTAALDVNTSMTVNNLSEPSTSLGTAQLNVASSTTLTLNQTASATFAGTLSLGGSAALTLNQGSGNTLTISGAPTLASLSSVLVNSGTLALTNNTNSPATVVGSASVSVASGATLQLAGSQAALSSAVNITTQGSGSAGDGALMVVGTTNQTVGVVSGNTVGSGPVTMYSGNTTVGDGTNAANLTATQILQNTLTINAGSTVTIAPSGSGIQTEDDVSAATAISAVSSSAVASSTATADSDSSSDPFTAIQAAIASGSISSAKGQQLENRIAEIEQLATTDPGLDVSILEDRVLAMLPSPSVWSSTGAGSSSTPLGETGSGLLAVDSSTFGSSSDSTSGSAAAAAFAPSAAFSGSPAAVPEPSTLLLAALGGIGIAAAGRRRIVRRVILASSKIDP